MKLWHWGFVCCFVIIGLIACNQTNNKVPIQENTDEPLMVSKHQIKFDAAFSVFLHQYYQLSDGLYHQQMNTMNKAATDMMTAADSLPFQLLKADTVIIETAQQNVANIKADLAGMVGEQNMQEKLKGFAAVSQALYDLIRTVQYSKETVYHFHCSTVFNNAGADWLSNCSEIQNPYLPKAKTVCGSLLDSLQFKP
ncbi:hypothetical protein [Hydrotalea sp.]|uniref:hypothetical protein n=1 Tax=Hydrotalea sp. TaxID=2881279 RepID=UPI002586E81A|nr:hypothetical protein [Hydrotalea sp.]